MATIPPPPPPRLQAPAGPRVSFNRDVHIKRFGNKPPPPPLPPKDISKYRRKSYNSDVVDEANSVLYEIEKANKPLDTTPNKFHSLPTRKKHKTQKPVSRSVSDASTRKPLLKKLFSRKSESNVNKIGKIERDPRFEDGGARRLIRSKSDASSNRNIKDKVMKKRSEAIGSSVNQLSPIIENALKEDYFEEIASKERWKSDDNLDEFPSDNLLKSPTGKMHSSQLPAERPALTKGMKVDNIVKRLSVERISPPPTTLGPTFSYIYPNTVNVSSDDLLEKDLCNSVKRESSKVEKSTERESLDSGVSNRNKGLICDTENNNHRCYLDKNTEDNHFIRSSISPWRRLTPPNDDIDSHKINNKDKSYSPPNNILKEQNYNNGERYEPRKRWDLETNGSMNKLNTLSERRRNLEDRIFSRGKSMEREQSCPPTLFYKPKALEIEMKYSPERTHLDIIQSPSFKSTKLVREKEYDRPHFHHKSTDSLRKANVSKDTSDYKNSLRNDRHFEDNKFDSGRFSFQKSKRACESFLRQERKYAEELSEGKKYMNSYRERSIDDGSLFDPRIDKYPISRLSLNRKRNTSKKNESKESSPSSLKTKSILKRTIFGSNHSDKNKKSSKMEAPPQPPPRVIDYSTRRRLSTPKASPILVRTMSEKKTPELPKPAPMTWFKSLTRSKSKSSEKQLKPATSLTFFGESDLDSIISPTGSTVSRLKSSNINGTISRSTQHLNEYSRASADEIDIGKRSRNYDSGSDELENTLKRRSRSLSKEQLTRRRQLLEQGPPKPPRLLKNSHRKYVNSSEDEQSLNSQQSVVYLHAKTVGDIPQPYKYTSPRSDISKTIKTDGTVPMQRTVIKSFNVNAPWTPKKISDGYEIDYSADQDRRMKKHQM